MQLAGGVAAIQLQNKEYDGRQTSCFHLIRPDGSTEDVSYRCDFVGVLRQWECQCLIVWYKNLLPNVEHMGGRVNLFGGPCTSTHHSMGKRPPLL